MQFVLTNATVVLPDGAIYATVVVQDGRIADVQPGRSSSPGALDLDGDFLVAGLVDLHTDNLERQVQPRQNARWPSRSALVAHDAQCAAAGVTTVFDALCVGNAGFDDDRPRTCTEGVADLDALLPTGLLKADHFLHLRCELPAEGMLEQLDLFVGHHLLRMASLMDHTPGIGQFSDLDRYRAMRLRDGEPPSHVDRRIQELQVQRSVLRAPNRRGVLERFAGEPVTLASHDDVDADDVSENVADGIMVSEFPVTADAASAARNAGMGIIAGAPNLVRGGSHSGNVSVESLLLAGLVDALASDYVPASMLHAAFHAAEQDILVLWKALDVVSGAPARMVGLDDRGSIVAGMRADMIRVRLLNDLPVVREVWVQGVRAA